MVGIFLFNNICICRSLSLHLDMELTTTVKNMPIVGKIFLASLTVLLVVSLIVKVLHQIN